MKINEDCVRDVLECLVDNLHLIIINEVKGDFNSIDLLKLMKYFENKYSQEEVWYSVYNLEQDGYIETDGVRERSVSGFTYVHISNVTHRGHEFYESIKPQSVWKKTKSVISKVGVHTLGFIESVAHDVAVESAKQLINPLTVKECVEPSG